MTTTSPRTTTLTDRYVHAATRRLSDDQREDVARELRASIEDGIDARLDAQRDLDALEAEHEVLLELGDPDRLSAAYTGAVQHLVGPDLYPLYARVLRKILLTVVPVVTLVVVLVDVFEDESFGALLGQAIGTTFSVGIQVVFWVTLGFAIAERTTDTSRPDDAGLPVWTPDDLPEVPSASRASIGETIANVAWLGVLAGLIVLQHFRSPVTEGNERTPVLDPDLWSFWLPLILAMLALEALFEIVKHRAGGAWTPAFAALNTVTGLAFAAPVIWLAAHDRLLNPAFTAYVQENWAEFDPDTTHTVILVSAVAIWLFDSVDGWRKALGSHDNLDKLRSH